MGSRSGSSSMASLKSSNKEKDEDLPITWEADRLEDQVVAQTSTDPKISGKSDFLNLELFKSRIKLGETVKRYTGPYEGRPAAPLLYSDDCKRLIRAASDGRLDDVKTLVESGIKANAEDGAALIAASANNHLEVVKYLVAQGADVNVQQGDALISAAGKGY